MLLVQTTATGPAWSPRSGLAAAIVSTHPTPCGLALHGLIDDRVPPIDRLRLVGDVEFLGPLYFRQGRADGPPATPFVRNLPDTLELAKDRGPNIGVILDAWHWHHSRSTIADIHADKRASSTRTSPTRKRRRALEAGRRGKRVVRV